MTEIFFLSSTWNVFAALDSLPRVKNVGYAFSITIKIKQTSKTCYTAFRRSCKFSGERETSDHKDQRTDPPRGASKLVNIINFHQRKQYGDF